MTDPHDFQRSAVEAILASYGRFCVTFEMAVFRLRWVIENVLKVGGLSNMGILQVLLANQTAEPLRALMYPLIAQVRSLSADEKAAVNSVDKRFQKLITNRNEVVHSTWFIMGLGQKDIDYETLRGFKLHRKKAEGSLNSFVTNEQTLNSLTAEAEILADYFICLASAIGRGEPIDSEIRRNKSGLFLPNFAKYWPDA